MGATAGTWLWGAVELARDPHGDCDWHVHLGDMALCAVFGPDSWWVRLFGGWGVLAMRDDAYPGVADRFRHRFHIRAGRWFLEPTRSDPEWWRWIHG